jgi:polysaccharide biosynthesis transport protein
MPEQSQDLGKTLNHYLKIAIRRRWWLLVTTCGVAIATVLGSLLLPNQYTSQATILALQQQVAQRYVTPNSSYSVREALDSLTQAVLSRSRLLALIQEFGLYPKESHRLGPEGLVQLMRKNIEIDPIQKEPDSPDVNAFKISFTADAPKVAQQITVRLTYLFIDENLRLQEEQDTGTTSFLKGQLTGAESQLKEQEQHLRNFRMQYLGELPEQQEGNLAILSGLHMQLQNTMGEISRAQEQHVYLTSLLDQYKSLSAATGAAPGAATPSPLMSAQQDLDKLKSRRAALLTQYTAKYPGVQEIEEEIAQQEALVARLRTHNRPGAKSGQLSSFMSPGGSDSSSVAQLNSQLEANRVERANLAKVEKNLESQIAVYEQRLNLTPVRQQQLADISRNYDLSKKNYTDLLNKVTQSELATSLQQRQQGQQFRVIDPASLPEQPSSPDHLKIALGGMAAGLLLGAALAYFIDSMDHAFYSEKDLAAQLKLPIVVALPAVLLPSEERRRAWKRILEWCAATALVVVLVLVEYYVYRGAGRL